MFETAMIGHNVLFGILSLFSAILIGNLFYIKRLNPKLKPSRFPLVSILVPARNEGKNIEGCVRSLLGQDYPNFELMVLDDHSEDKTSEILEKIAAEDSRLEILKGEDLPVGWLGKCFACQQLAAVSSGEYLLFTDADTAHAPGTVAAAMAAMEADNADLLTLITRLEMKTWSEKLILPLIHFIALAHLPFPWIKLLSHPILSVGNGQFMFFRRQVYDVIGGHKSVRSALVEDVWLARRVKAFKYTVSMRDGSGMVSCRMYRDFGEVWEGFSKNIFAGFNYSLMGWFAMLIFLAAVYVLPPSLLIADLLRRRAVWDWFYPAVETFLVIAMRILLAFRFRLGILSSFFHPLGMACLLVIAVNSARCILAGKGALWKGRTYKFHSQKGINSLKEPL